ncbi:MAG: hypothetical protein FWC23_05275 [Chitinispirillia bacterium]|nr:hypothetical protein [Chitinispirillia bacterium]MCL2268580.1 hypothetical protein [Chitinispirillia bacterium]
MLKRNFAIALAYSGLKAAEWARGNGFYHSNVIQVLSGEVTSARILHAVEGFTNEQLSALAKELVGVA